MLFIEHQLPGKLIIEHNNFLIYVFFYLSLAMYLNTQLISL